ncbi:hypothetical protein G7Y89_g4356 [Cudoniella acicularis]|uniref:Thioredoxin domain-containing protein n=1 Tax=Cudoniella acicularis TaxID=354080 RepID=A0A8H4RRR7_9HELO|nr:hypothetical protein G7Y89_g4356 [Cudoniella acicularis]
MPLQVTSETPSAIASSLKSSPSKPAFLVVYASLTDGRSWCGDCRRAEPFVNAKFGGADDIVRVVYAGQRDEWRKQDNPWRLEPFLVTNLPTLIKVTEEGKWEKLVEGDVYDQKILDVFVGKLPRPDKL